ncbi:protein takeout-like [Culicoides brevitarsis]|uniref:protein takeout-like n=1 Tax=Culicoides brevitarsis TaxID=469753 RepID=UPI00307C0634
MRFFVSLSTLSLILLQISSSFAKLPDDIIKCEISDFLCIRDRAQFVLTKYYMGNEQMGLKSLDPLKVEAMKITETTEEKRNVNINLNFHNLNVYGTRKATVNQLKITNRTTKNFEIDFRATFPRIELIGEYTVNGKVLLLPITGAGKCNITGEIMKLTVNLQGNFVQHNGKDYLFIKRIGPSACEISHAYISLENLFNGNKLLGDGMNRFLNENWAELWKELHPAFIQTFGNVGLDIANNVFQRNPVSKLFV